MKTLLAKAGGNIGTARRWIDWIRQRRNLQARVEALGYEAATCRVQIANLRNDIEARDALIRDMRRIQNKIPDDARLLLDQAHAVFERALHSKSMSVADFGGWLSEYRASRFVRASVRHGLEWHSG